MKPNPHRAIRKTGRAALLWTLGLLVLSQAALGVWLHRRHPEMCDPTFEFRYNRLQACLHGSGGGPLVLVLGSSRVANGFSPGTMTDWQPRQGPTAVAFNFATLGGGPVRELLTYHRLLARGIRPNLLFVEVWPAFLSANPNPLYAEREPILSGDQHLSDRRFVEHLYGKGWECLTKVSDETLTPLLHSRVEFLNQYAPCLVPRQTDSNIVWGRIQWSTLDSWGWLPVMWGRPTPEVFAEKLEVARKVTQPGLAKLQCSAEADWSLRQLVRGCQANGTRVVFFLMPEHSALRSWYTPHTHAVLKDYFQQLEREFGTPTLDTREWVADEGFVDYCHMLPAGATAYSARFGREVLRPLLEGSALPAQLFFRGPNEMPGYGGASAATSVVP